jgi:hypothetical protein
LATDAAGKMKLKEMLQDVEEHLSRRPDGVFWTLYFVVPFLTGILVYNWLPDESFDSDHHIALAQHTVCEDRDEGQRCGEVYDIWKDKKTGKIYRLTDFEDHRRSETNRMALTWFFYGLIGCSFYAYKKSKVDGKRFITEMGKAMLVDFFVTAYMYIQNEATNDRILR